MASLLLKGVHKRLGLPSITISCSSAAATNIIASTTTRNGEAPSPLQQAETSSSSSSASSSSEITAVQEEEQQKAAVLARSSTTTERRTTQVVVLRVSLHCKGCAGKVKKHIAKMEGVTSFDIDIPSKKVTVVGDVTPLGVLTSVSKVKPAQFWPSPPRPPRASASF
uniref:HMA domain-containing protein n=1 Tax=Aegilops tauschii TaxID=37682 RepID=M8CR11_AEGTA